MSRRKAQRLSDHELEAYVRRMEHIAFNPSLRRHYAAALAELIKREAACG